MVLPSGCVGSIRAFRARPVRHSDGLSSSGSCRAATYAARQPGGCSGVLRRQSTAKASSVGPCPPPAWAAAAAKEDSTGSSQGPWPPWGGANRETQAPACPPRRAWVGSTGTHVPRRCPPSQSIQHSAGQGFWQSGGRLGCLTNFNPILSHASTGLGCWQVEHKPLET